MAKTKQERGICELYADDPERADLMLFGRRAEEGRRGFLKGAGLAAMGAVVGAAIPFHRNMPGGLIPAALAESTKDFKIEGKSGDFTVTLREDHATSRKTLVIPSRPMPGWRLRSPTLSTTTWTR